MEVLRLNVNAEDVFRGCLDVAGQSTRAAMQFVDKSLSSTKKDSTNRDKCEAVCDLLDSASLSVGQAVNIYLLAGSPRVPHETRAGCRLAFAIRDRPAVTSRDLPLVQAQPVLIFPKFDAKYYEFFKKKYTNTNLSLVSLQVLVGWVRGELWGGGHGRLVPRGLCDRVQPGDAFCEARAQASVGLVQAEPL